MKKLRGILLLAVACGAFSCQQTDESAAMAVGASTNQTVAATTPTRPAPDFYIIPPEMAQDHVWLCIDNASDLFHEQHDCPLLVQCKGTFRSVKLVRAIEDFGRYNCPECSQHLDHIFDEDMVR
ncbi:hypothetical protein MKJ04_06710 [Pontibacter sp. E15-1]|uniref:hypothetical protein n=1 Tax=Pontibacter sp. E15-1 TaxID=2919918 RepID=UPI001F500E5A|nr:hypothetical protein [Pontibacter sp. E15-1]MCJ8164532.1 hypothetical protein [Pontibacter sp. E15-1]